MSDDLLSRAIEIVRKRKMAAGGPDAPVNEPYVPEIDAVQRALLGTGVELTELAGWIVETVARKRQVHQEAGEALADVMFEALLIGITVERLRVQEER